MIGFLARGFQQVKQWFEAELPSEDSWLTSKNETQTHQHNEYVFTLRMELPALLEREEAFRQRLKREHKKRWNTFVRTHWYKQTRKNTRRSMWRLAPAILITFGSVLMANALWPIASYFVFTSPMLRQPELVSPIPDNPVIRQASSIAQAQANVTAPEMVKPKIIRDDLDYTNLSSWFPAGTPDLPVTAEEDTAKTYFVDIPTLGIEQAEVKVGGLDLDNNLIQYPGTADPGEFGAPVIFGHSVLRQFYNPSLKNPRRYMSIFSKIMTMQTGEKIYITYDGIRYTYSVVRKVEVKPEDVYILEQQYNSRQLKLVTCTPEGTYLRRGVVLAELETMEETSARGEQL